MLALVAATGALIWAAPGSAATSFSKSDDRAWNAEVTANPHNELVCLAQAIYFESRGEPADGQIAVAEVIVNRARDKKFPNSICGVVFQGSERRNSCQFSFACDGKKDVATNQKSWKFAKDLALTVMQGQLNPVTRNATHYHNDTVRPRWARKLEKTVKIGKHIFYRLPQRTASN